MGYIKNVAKSFTMAAPVILKNKFTDIVHTIDSLGKQNRQEMTQMFKQSGLLIKTQTKSAFSDSLKNIKRCNVW